MKKYIFLSVIAVFALSCGSNPDSKLEHLEAKRDSLKLVYTQLGKDLVLIEKEIASLDTSVVLASVGVLKVEKATFRHYFTAQGSVVTDQNALVYPEAQGLIEKVLVEKGAQVKKGQVIMQIDKDMIERSIQELEAGYDLRTEVYERQKKLWEQNIGSEIEYLRAKSEKEMLEGKMAQMKKQLALTRITAPFDGVVDDIMLNEGEMANFQLPACRVLNLDQMYIKADISESRLNAVKENMPVTVILPGLDTLDAKVSRVGNYIKPENRTFQVQVDLKTDHAVLRPNLFATLKINDLKMDSVVILPARLIQQDASGANFVKVVREEAGEMRVHKVFVSTGDSYEGQVVIMQGLSGGEWIIEKGIKKVSEGDQVLVL